MNYFNSKRNAIFYIAEIGGNHEGDFEYAKQLTNLAIESGADAIKYQFYTGDTLVSRVESEDRNKHFKKFELSEEQNIYLMKMVADAGRIPMASVWNKDMLSWADPYLPIHKVGSGDMTCFPVIKALVKTGKPIILSTGLSTLLEVKETVDYIFNLDDSYKSESKLALLQCTSSYPTPDDDANIGVIKQFQKEFRLPVGYSDHTEGSLAIEIAATLGAKIIEKHFTDTRKDKVFRDHKISLTSSEVAEYIDKVSRIRILKGNAEKVLTNSEKAAMHHVSFRRSVYCKVDIKQGEVLDENNLTVLRPEHGIPAKNYNKVLGRVAKRDLKAHEVINDGDIT